MNKPLLGAVPEASLYQSLVQQRQQFSLLKQELGGQKNLLKQMTEKEKSLSREIAGLSREIRIVEEELRKLQAEKEALLLTSQAVATDLPGMRSTLDRYNAAILEFMKEWQLLLKRKKEAWLHASVAEPAISLQTLNVYTKYYFSKLLGQRREKECLLLALQRQDGELRAKQEGILKREEELLSRQNQLNEMTLMREVSLKETRIRVTELKRKMGEAASASKGVQETMLRLEQELQGEGAFLHYKGRLSHPVEGKIVSHASIEEKLKIAGGFFKSGVSYATLPGADVRAVAAGQVAFVGEMEPYRRLIILDHGEGYFSVLAFLREFQVKQGERVAAGRKIGTASDWTYCEIRFHLDTLNATEWFVARK